MILTAWLLPSGELKSDDLISISKKPKNCSAAAREHCDGGWILSMPCEFANSPGKTVHSLTSSRISVASIEAA